MCDLDEPYNKLKKQKVTYMSNSRNIIWMHRITAEFIQQIIKDSNAPQLEKRTKSPATSELFEVHDDSTFLSKDKSD
jgi:hypothetical protein